MAYFDPNTTVDSKARNTSVIPIKEGQFLITTDTRSLFYDLGDKRIQLTDILVLDTEAERAALLAPVNTFYFVKDTGSLWRYMDGTWLEWPCSGSKGAIINYVEKTLTAAGWSNSQQVVSVDGLSAEQNGVVGLSQKISASEYEAAGSASMYVCGQADGSLTIALGGDKPTCDIPIALILFAD